MTRGFTSERELEDFICRYPYAYAHGSPYDGKREIIARQLNLPHGILDLLVLRTTERRTSVEIVELKNGPITHKAIAQVLRYQGDIQNILGVATDQESTRYEPEFPLEFGRSCHLGSYYSELLVPVLIGTEIGEHGLEACDAGRILVYTFHFEGNTVCFDWQMGNIEKAKQIARSNPTWVQNIMVRFRQQAVMDSVFDVMRDNQYQGAGAIIGTHSN